MNAPQLAEHWLSEAYDLVAQGWCQGALAASETGAAVPADSERACRWSACGALVRVAGAARVDLDVALYALCRCNLALMAAVNDVPGTWNDAAGRRQDEVLDALLRAVGLVQHPSRVSANGH